MTDIFEYLFEYKRAVVIYSNSIFEYIKSVINCCNFEDMYTHFVFEYIFEYMTIEGSYSNIVFEY